MGVVRHFGRAAYYLVLAAAAVAAVGTALDHATRDAPQLARLVPGPFRAEADAALARAALEHGAGATAFSTAAHLLGGSPVPAENLSLFAQAAIVAGRADAAGIALTAAGSRGWRDPLVQLAMIDGAILSQDWKVAAQRLGAMQRVEVPAKYTDLMLKRLAAVPAGRSALAVQIAASPEWSGNFLANAGAVLPTADFTEVVAQVVRHDPSYIACADLSKAAGALIARAEAAAADRIWSGACAQRAPDGRGAAQFIPVGEDGADGPYSWFYPDDGGLDRGFQQRGGRWVLDFVNNDPLQHTVAIRRMRLSPGRHWVRAVMLADGAAGGLPAGNLTTGGLPADGLPLRLACVAVDGRQTLVPVEPLSTTPVALIVPPTGCAMQELQLAARPGSSVSGLAIEVSAN